MRRLPSPVVQHGPRRRARSPLTTAALVLAAVLTGLLLGGCFTVDGRGAGAPADAEQPAGPDGRPAGGADGPGAPGADGETPAPARSGDAPGREKEHAEDGERERAADPEDAAEPPAAPDHTPVTPTVSASVPGVEEPEPSSSATSPPSDPPPPEPAPSESEPEEEEEDVEQRASRR